mmetsp:Transcript_43576/g.85332  ORF Transcript_43576/g.85332 Transcript_43576/m.85332 type:complete len:90 (-) Transcript_43576:1330-1599(-)
MLRVREAYCKVRSLSEECWEAGDRHAIIRVMPLPPKESDSSLVITLSLYGTWCEAGFFASRDVPESLNHTAKSKQALVDGSGLFGGRSN